MELRLTLARHFDNATKREVWTATCLVLRKRIIDRFIETQAAHNEGSGTRRVYYLSLEYLMGRLLNVNLCNTGMRDAVEAALSELGFDLGLLCEEEHDMGLGLPFRDGAFDGAVSVSALQWLCYDNDAASSAPRRLNRFFASLYRCLRAGGRAALQFYPENDAQAALIAAAAQRAGFAGGVVVDFPRSTKARKHYLCLSTERRYRAPDARDAAGAPRRRGGGRKRGRDWVLDKKAHQRKKGGRVRPDSKFTGRKRKDKF